MASQLTFSEVRFSGLELHTYDNSFLALSVLEIEINNYSISFQNCLFQNITGTINLGILFSLTLNGKTTVRFTNTSFIDLNFRMIMTVVVSVNKAGLIEITDFGIENSRFVQGLNLANSEQLNVSMVRFSGNNILDGTMMFPTQSALYIQDIFYCVMSNAVFLDSQSDLTATGLIISLPNLMFNTVQGKFVLNKTIFAWNLAFSTGRIFYGGCAVYLSSVVDTDILVLNSSFRQNEIKIVSPFLLDIVGASAIRSIGLGESIILKNCEFINQSSTHLSSAIWFEGNLLQIICKVGSWKGFLLF